MATLTERQRNRIRKRKAELTLLSGETISYENIVVDAEGIKPAKFAKDLCRQIIDKRQQKTGPELVLNLHKLGSRGPNAHDLASLIHYVLIGSYVSKPNWLHFKDIRKHLQTVLLRVNCLERHLKSTGDFINDFFEKRWIRMEQEVCNRSAFWRAITTVKQSKLEMLKQKVSKDSDILEKLRGNDLKLSLLMSLDQMIASHYPLADRIEDTTGAELRIIPSKRRYRKPTADSPVFIMDCEMCLTNGNRSELTRISIIREDGSILFDTFVKPLSPITNYLTEHSGITAEMLADVRVRLLDVQRAIRRLLPSDAILCGHSLEFDLRALQMSHPFCIDLSTHFNFSNNPRLKTSLRTLSQIFLREDIQRTKSGHCSMEDSLATLKLLRLKIENGLVFGNVILGWSFKQWAAANGLSELGTRRSEIIEGARRMIDAVSGSDDPPVKRIADKFDTVAANTADSARRRACVQCTGPIWINCEIRQCLCTRFSASRSADEAAEHQRRAYARLCVSCISATCMPSTSDDVTIESSAVVTESDGTTESVSDKVDKETTDEEEEGSDSSVDARGNEDLEKLMGADDVDEDDGDKFDFRSALRINNVSRSKVRLSNVMANTSDAKTNFLCAIRNPSEFVSSSQRCRLVSVDSAMHLTDEVAPSLIEYSAAVLEAHCDDDASTSQLVDDVVRAVVDGVCVNGLVIVVLASPKRSLLYIRLKR